MGEYAGRFPEPAQRAWWLRALHVELLVAAAALLTLLAGEAVYALEARDDDDHVHDHGFYGPIFDVAWVVFVPAFAVALLGGVVALAAGALARNVAVTRYGIRATAFCAFALAVVALVEVLGS